MPVCGSQIVLCDLPVRFDTYKGCSHACSYCFVKRKSDISNIEKGETPTQLNNFINGARNATIPFSWDIPLHWGGMSDPFQPCERVQKVSLECLKVFERTQYPFVVSSKGASLMSEEPYFSLLVNSNCVIQISAACRSYDEIERGASTFEQRIKAAEKFSKQGKRVNIRVQPYIPKYYREIYDALEEMANAGVHGVIFESMKYQKKMPGLIKVMGDFCYKTSILLPQFTRLKQRCHELGMKFYCGENRLRQLSDELCCCGIEGMGWQPNTFNLNHMMFDKEGVNIPDSLKNANPLAFRCMYQNSADYNAIKKLPFEQIMKRFMSKKWCSVLLPDKN